MKPPEIILRYFQAANAGLVDPTLDCFSAAAVVKDESRTHTGSEAIRAWIEETTLQYRPQVEVLGTERADGAVLVTGRVSGNFPSSPVELEYRFVLEGDRISHLSID